MIFEVVITTVDLNNTPHVAPMGITKKSELIVLKPFKPSLTLSNILSTKIAILNISTDVRVFAGCVTGRNKFELKAIEKNKGFRLASPISYSFLSLQRFVDDDLRPQLLMKEEESWQLNKFRGLNRAQAAVVEASVLVSRLNILPINKILSEMEYLNIAVSKTAGPKEKLAWSWLEDTINDHVKKIKNLNNEIKQKF